VPSRTPSQVCLLGFGYSEKAITEYSSGGLWADQLRDFITEVGRPGPCVRHAGARHRLMGPRRGWQGMVQRCSKLLIFVVRRIEQKRSSIGLCAPSFFFFAL
jgi:hypothetical protein